MRSTPRPTLPNAKSDADRVQVGLAQIAAEAGVSVPTVSYILNGRAKERKISTATSDRVVEVATRLGYVPNGLARNLRLRFTHSVALLVSDLERSWANRVMKGMIQALDPHGYTTAVSVHMWDPKRELRELSSFIEDRKAAIILRPMGVNKDFYNTITRRGVPLVMLDEVPGVAGVSTIMWDTRASIRESIRGLADRGRRRIGFLGVLRGTQEGELRYKHYRTALQELNLPFDPSWDCRDELHPLEEETGDRAGRVRHYGDQLRRLLCRRKARPDAILASNDALACTCLTIARDDLHLKVPEEIAIMGMGDVGETPLIGLSSSREPLEALGRAAGEVALGMIGGGAEAVQHRRIELCEVSFRTTTPPLVVKSC